MALDKGKNQILNDYQNSYKEKKKFAQNCTDLHRLAQICITLLHPYWDDVKEYFGVLNDYHWFL